MILLLCILFAAVCMIGAYFFGSWNGWNAGGRDAMLHPEDWKDPIEDRPSRPNPL